jgi:hypothetical protein
LDSGFLHYAASKGVRMLRVSPKLHGSGWQLPRGPARQCLGWKLPLLNSAKSLAYPPEGTVGAQVKKIAADFGLSEQVLAKTKPQAEALVNPSL